MKSFKTFLSDILFPAQLNESMAENTQHITHLSHVEDLGHEYGHAGGEHAISALHDAASHIEHGAHNSNLTTKIDGGVSVVAGHHPHSGKFFVGYKGAIKHIGGEKETKLSYSHADIDKHFGDKPYLKDKMKSVLDHAHKILPKHGIYQGDMLFDKHSKHDEGNKVSFTPNTIKYAANKNTQEGKKIEKAQLGISFHTAYHPHPGGGIHSAPVKHEELKHHEDAYNLSTANDTSKANYHEQDKHNFKEHMAKAEKIHEKGGHEMYHAVEPVKDHLGTYINKTVREDTKPTVEGLQHHIINHGQNLAAKVKTEKAKEVKINTHHALASHVWNNSQHFDKYLNMHHHLQQAKNTLVHVLDKADHPLEHTIKGEKSHPEGYVFSHKSIPVKLVDRKEFSKKNFEKSRD